MLWMGEGDRDLHCWKVDEQSFFKILVQEMFSDISSFDLKKKTFKNDF